MTLQPGEVADVANVVAIAIFIDVFVIHLLPGQLLDTVKSFEDRARILPTNADVIHLTTTWVVVDLFDGPRNVVAVDVIADLFTLVAKDAISPAQKLNFNQVREKPVELDP
jgi:hypothetical protein